MEGDLAGTHTQLDIWLWVQSRVAQVILCMWAEEGGCTNGDFVVEGFSPIIANTAQPVDFSQIPA